MPRFARRWSIGVLAAGLGALMLTAGPGQAQVDASAFGQFLAGTDVALMARFNYGRGIFHHDFPILAQPDGRTGMLGPLYNAARCAGCHIADGRGAAPGSGTGGFVLQIGRRPAVAGTAPLPDPVYGQQVQDKAVPGATPEARIEVEYRETGLQLSDGTAVSLRAPTYIVRDWADGAPAGDLVLGPRVAPAMIGLGLLAAVPAVALAAAADPFDADGDGVSGRLNFVVDPVSGRTVAGRFGWKASMPSVAAQVEQAARVDIGLSTPNRRDAIWGDCTPAQTTCLRRAGTAPSGKPSEFGAEDFAAVAFYSERLAVPARRNQNDPLVVAGEVLFGASGCTACHVPSLRTAASGVAAEFVDREVPAFTDLLVHDLGPGLADGLGAGLALPSEWRTAPLWGIGLAQTVNPNAGFLHDGRARTLSEAILWHGGEAEAARDTFAEMDAVAREALLAFLNSL